MVAPFAPVWSAYWRRLATDDTVGIRLGSTTGAGMFATVTVTTQADWASLLLSLRYKLFPRQPPQH